METQVSGIVCGAAEIRAGRMEKTGRRRDSSRDHEPLVKNTTNQIKDSFLVRAESSFLLSDGRGQPGPPAPGTPSSLLLLPLPLSHTLTLLTLWTAVIW